MKEYYIYHSTDLESYEWVAVVKANNLDDCFIKSQNDFSNDYARYGVRSTMIGDIYVDQSDMKQYEVIGMGFKEVSINNINVALVL